MSDLESSNIVAASAAVIALCALAVSIWQAFLMRRHNVISLKPHLDVLVSTVDDSYSINIVNNGFGPAIVNEIVVRLGNSSHAIRCESDYRLLVNLFMREGGSYDYTFFAFDNNSAVAAGQSITILSVSISKNTPGSISNFDRSIRRSEIHVEYSSLYEEKYKACFNGVNVSA